MARVVRGAQHGGRPGDKRCDLVPNTCVGVSPSQFFWGEGVINSFFGVSEWLWAKKQSGLVRGLPETFREVSQFRELGSLRLRASWMVAVAGGVSCQGKGPPKDAGLSCELRDLPQERKKVTYTTLLLFALPY